MNIMKFLARWRLAIVKRGPWRAVGHARNGRRYSSSDWLHRLETRQLLSGLVTETVSYSSSIPVQITDYNATLPLTKFNPALGTLTKVDVAISAAGVLNGTVTNNGTDPETLTIAEEIDLSLLDGSTPLLDPKLNAAQTFDNLVSGEGAIFGPFAPTQNLEANFTSGSTFNDFGSGPGTIDLSLVTNTAQTTTGGGGNISSDLTTEAGATAYVTYTYSVATVSISGNVYEDQKALQALAPGDPPIPGTLLTLVDSSGTTVATTTTAADGSYSFNTATGGGPLFAGTYAVVETQPTGYLQGTNTVGNVNGVTDGALGGVDVIGSIVLQPGQDSIGNNFGEVLPVGLTGTVYEDKIGTGALAAGDPPIPGVTLTLLDLSGSILATTTTDAHGNYSFTTTTAGAPLAPGTYAVVESQPAAYLQGSNTVGTVNGVTDGILGGVDVIAVIGLNSGQVSVANNFGEVLPVALSGSVYDDVNRDGRLDAGDTPIGGVTVNLYDSAGLVATTTTNVSGNYAFETTTSGAPLRPDTYTIMEIQPSGFLQGTNTVGTVNGVTNGSLPATDFIGSIVLTSGQATVANNFGELTALIPVTVINVQRFGVHLQPTLIVISVNTPLNPATANDVANYQIYGPTDSKHPALIPIDSATYNPATNMVTLRLGERLNVHHPYQLTINGLESSTGAGLVGSNGVVGTPYVTTLSRTALSGFTDIYGNFIPIDSGKLYPAAITSGYQLKRFVQPANLGSFASTNKATFLAATLGDPETPPIAYRSVKKLTLTSRRHH